MDEKYTRSGVQILHTLPIIILAIKQGTSNTEYFALPSNTSKTK